MRPAPLGLKTACKCDEVPVRVLHIGMTHSLALPTSCSSCHAARAQKTAAGLHSASCRGQAAGEMAEVLQLATGEGLAACTAG